MISLPDQMGTILQPHQMFLVNIINSVFLVFIARSKSILQETANCLLPD